MCCSPSFIGEDDHDYFKSLDAVGAKIADESNPRSESSVAEWTGECWSRVYQRCGAESALAMLALLLLFWNATCLVPRHPDLSKVRQAEFSCARSSQESMLMLQHFKDAFKQSL